jgi:hypothetical protein
MLVLSLSQRIQHNSIKEEQRQKWAFSWARPTLWAERAVTVWDFGKAKRLITIFFKMYFIVHRDYVYIPYLGTNIKYNRNKNKMFFFKGWGRGLRNGSHI